MVHLTWACKFVNYLGAQDDSYDLTRWCQGHQGQLGHCEVHKQQFCLTMPYLLKLPAKYFYPLV